MLARVCKAGSLGLTGGGGPGPGAYAGDVDAPFASSRVDFSSSAHPSAPFAKATRAGVTFERADDDETPGPAHYAAGAKPLASGIPGKGIWASDGRPRLGGASESRSTAAAPGPHHYDSAPTRLGAGKPGGRGATAAFSTSSAEAVEAMEDVVTVEDVVAAEDAAAAVVDLSTVLISN